MKSLFLTTPCLLVALAAGLFIQRTPMIPIAIGTGTVSSPTGNTYCVFVIDIDNRNTQADVENLANWRYLGTTDENIPSCGPGRLQACQLIVDAHDTELAKDGTRILKPGVLISAMLNKEAAVWYVSDYTPVGFYLYEILNEENDIE